MTERSDFYVYEYLREKDSDTAKAGTPYYVGKGSGNRAYNYNGGGRKPPKDKNRIVFQYRNLTESEAFEKEKELIARYGRKNNGSGILINRTDGGEGSSGAVKSDETRRKLSEAARNFSPETRKKIAEANRNKIISAETRRKLSDANRGKKQSDKTRKKIGEAHRNKIISAETRRKLSEANRGKKQSDKTRGKISEKLKKPVLINGVEYPSVGEAYHVLGLSPKIFYSRVKSGKLKVEYL